MSPPPGSATRVPSPAGPLRALLALLLLLTAPGARAAGGPSAVVVAGELRCVCLALTPKVHPKMISSLEMVPSGPQCPRVEMIATLKNGKQVCLDTEAPLIKKIIQKMLDSGKQKN